MSNALSLVEAGTRDLERATERLVLREMREIVDHGTLDATNVDDEGPVPEDWNQRRARIARDLRKPKKNAPFYIEVMARRLEIHDRIEAERENGRSVQLNIGQINIVQAPEYPVVDVNTIEVK